MNRFSKFVEATTDSCPYLPLIHICDAYCFRGILENRKICVSPCRKFVGDSLVYTFYGRPSYRVSSSDGATQNPSFFPICIVLDYSKLPQPKRIAPFDTGAFFNGLFSKFIHPSMKPDDFFLNPKISMARKLVSRYFENNSNYFEGKSIHFEIPIMEFEALIYKDLLATSFTQDGFDDRISSIEIQYDLPILLNKETVLLVVLPACFMDEDRISQIITGDWATEYRIYETYKFKINEYTSTFYREVREFLIANGYF